jgi:prevent-host-death family protein
LWIEAEEEPMLVDSKNIVPVDTLRKDLSKYLAAAQGGGGPVAITKNAEIVGFLIGRDEYEAMFGAAVTELLDSRSRGPTVSHDEARRRVRAAARGHKS